MPESQVSRIASSAPLFLADLLHSPSELFSPRYLSPHNSLFRYTPYAAIARSLRVPPNRSPSRISPTSVLFSLASPFIRAIPELDSSNPSFTRVPSSYSIPSPVSLTTGRWQDARREFMIVLIHRIVAFPNWQM